MIKLDDLTPDQIGLVDQAAYAIEDLQLDLFLKKKGYLVCNRQDIIDLLNNLQEKHEDLLS